MQSVKLISMTQPVDGFEFKTAQDLLSYVTRVSNPENQNNFDTAEKLIRYCLRNRHWSPFELIDLTFEIETTRDIGRQILRHKSFTFQEFCLSGDSEITVSGPSLNANRRYKLNKLYERYSKGLKIPSLIRTYEEATKSFKFAPIKEVFQTGEKDLFEVELFNGKRIKTTKEHKFLTEIGFRSLEEITEVSIIGDKAVWNGTDTAIGCNGVLAYRDRDWLLDKKKESIENRLGQQYIADQAGVSKATIHKWMAKLGVQYTKKEVASFTPSWNTGLRYSTGKKHSTKTIERMKRSAKRGPESNLWRGGVDRSERQKIADYIGSHWSELLRKFNYACNRCSSSVNLHLHHIKPVYSHPELAYDTDNIEVLCKKCHYEHHLINGDRKVWKESPPRGNTLVARWSKIKSIRYVGKEMTYDIQVDHVSHNYIANGIVVHNSQRYADPTQLGTTTREARMQDQKNRQNSIEITYEDGDRAALLVHEWNERQSSLLDHALKDYKWALDNGIAKEQARVVLPEGLTMSRMYMKSSLRSWIHYCDVRRGPETQKEHRQIANAIWEILKEQFTFLEEYNNAI